MPIFHNKPRLYYYSGTSIYIEVLLHIFYCYWSKENRSLYRRLRFIEVRYIEVPQKYKV